MIHQDVFFFAGGTWKYLDCFLAAKENILGPPGMAWSAHQHLTHWVVGPFIFS